MHRTLALSAAFLASSLIGTHVETRTIDGRPHTWSVPAGCTITQAWEDHSAIAQCSSGIIAYDPDGAQNRAAGTWYVPDYR